MMKYFCNKKIILLLLVILFSTCSITAQESNEGEVRLPVLNNHKFIVNQFVKSPFIKTYFRNSLGGGVAMDLNVPILIIDDEPLAGLRGELTFLTLEFEFQYAVNNWLAVFSNVGMISRFGTEPQAIIAQGLNATYGFELGWMLKIYERENIQISATANLWNQSGTVLNFYNFIQDIIDNGGLRPENRLLFSKDYIQGGIGFRGAWAPNRLIGVNGLAEFAFGESIDDSGTRVFYNLGGSADFDLKAISSVPIGFAVGFTVSTFLSGSDDSIDNASMNFFLRTSYTGRNDILISVDMTWNKIPISQSIETLTGITASVGLEYYF